MNESGERIMSFEAESLICDMADGCKVERYRLVLPWGVTPPAGSPTPLTNGQVIDPVVDQLVAQMMIEVRSAFSCTPQQTCKLTDLGEAYYRRHLSVSYIKRRLEANRDSS